MDQWKSILSHDVEVTFICCWCQAKFNYPQSSDLQTFIERHTKCTENLKVLITIDYNEIKVEIKNDNEEKYQLMIKSKEWTHKKLLKLTRMKFVNENYSIGEIEKHIHMGKLAPCLDFPTEIDCKICHEKKLTTLRNMTESEMEHFNVEFPLSLPMITLNNLVDFSSVKKLPPPEIIVKVKNDLPFRVGVALQKILVIVYNFRWFK